MSTKKKQTFYKTFRIHRHSANKYLQNKSIVYEQKRVNSLHGLLNCEIGGFECRAITTKYRTRVHCKHM